MDNRFIRVFTVIHNSRKYDFVPKTLKKAGAKIIFHKVSIRPGRPILFAKFSNGTAYFDNCEICTGGNTEKDPCIQDCNGIWGGNANQFDIEITIQEEPNADPTPPDAYQLVRGEDGLSITTMDQYDESDYNDYDDSLMVWFEPHNNNADLNPADLWFTAYNSDDADGMCEGDGPPTCVIDCSGFEDIMSETATEESVCSWIEGIVSDGTCLSDCDSNMWAEINEAVACCNNENCNIMGCPEGYVEDCSEDGDCIPDYWIGDGTCDGEDQPYDADLTCYEDDNGVGDGGRAGVQRYLEFLSRPTLR